MNLPYQRNRTHPLSKREKKIKDSYELSSSNNYSQKEKSYINKIKIKLSSLPSNKLLTDSDILRYLYLTDFQVETTIKTIKKRNKYLKQIKEQIEKIPNKYEIEKILTSLIFSVNSIDDSNHPNIDIDLNKYNSIMQSSIENIFISFHLFLLSVLILRPSYEKVNIIINLNHRRFESKNEIPKGMVKMMLNVQNVFPFRINKIFIMNVSDCDSFILKFISVIFHKHIYENIFIIKKSLDSNIRFIPFEPISVADVLNQENLNKFFEEPKMTEKKEVKQEIMVTQKEFDEENNNCKKDETDFLRASSYEDEVVNVEISDNDDYYQNFNDYNTNINRNKREVKNNNKCFIF